MTLRFRRWTLKDRRSLWLVGVPLLAFGAWHAWEAATYAASLRLYVVPSKSMSPTIAPGDRVCTEMKAGMTPGRGEIWVFAMPNGGLAVKRVIGLPGETVEVAGGRVLIDGAPLAEPYLTEPIGYAMPAVPLGPRQYIVLGDNRNLSSDSHLWGTLDESAFLGRVLTRCWPASRLGTVR